MTLSASNLLSRGFEYVGSWSDDKSRPHRAGWIKQMPGLYAFVVGDSVMYLGHTAFLDRRIRHYSRLALTKASGEPRDIHRKLVVCIHQRIEVAVLAKVIQSASIEYLGFELRKLVADIRPIWNVMANDALGEP